MHVLACWDSGGSVMSLTGFPAGILAHPPAEMVPQSIMLQHSYPQGWLEKSRHTVMFTFAYCIGISLSF